MLKPECTTESYLGLGHVPMGIGAILKGWDLTEEHFRKTEYLPVVDFRAMTDKCPHNCFHCFTDKRKKTLALSEIKNVIDQLAEMKTHAIDYLGEGEPTLDPDFFEIVRYTREKGIIPVVFTDAALKLRDKGFVRELKDTGASVCPKCDSLFNADYQNWVVRDQAGKFFQRRNEALRVLMDEGFNAKTEDGTTRLGFDMIVSTKNVQEIGKTLRYCRDRNLWIVFSTFLPSGRSSNDNFDQTLPLDEKQKISLRSEVKKIDRDEYGWDHPIYSNFATMHCVEFMQIYGDGRVSPCPGNETIVGNIRNNTITELRKIILEKFPAHFPKTFDGHCLYRPPMQEL